MASEVISHAIFASSHPTSPRTALSSTPPPTPCFAPHLALHSAQHPHELHPAPCTPLFTIPCAALRSLPAPHHALHPAPRPPFPSLSLSQVPPVDFLVRKKARFTHDMTFFHHDVRGKRFNAHGKSHNMEMIISKDHVAEKPRRGWDIWRHGRP